MSTNKRRGRPSGGKSPQADKVGGYLAKNPTATPTQVAKATGVSYGYTYRIMHPNRKWSTQRAERPHPIPTEEQISLPQMEEKGFFGKKPRANQRQVGGQHYVDLSVEPWEAMEAWMTKDAFVGFLKGNVIKYLARGKNADDLSKAGHYMQKLLETKHLDAEYLETE